MVKKRQVSFLELRHKDSLPLDDIESIGIGKIEVDKVVDPNYSDKPYDWAKEDLVSILPENQPNIQSILPRLIGKRMLELGESQSAQKQMFERDHSSGSE